MTNKITAELEAGLEDIRNSPKHAGRLEMVIMRPAENERKVLESADLDPEHGVVGDNWAQRGSERSHDGSAHPDMQLNIMNARFTNLIAGSRERWPLAGDQLYVDFDLSEANLPPWTKLAIGDAVIQITDQPHHGCQKFSARFGVDALRFVNSEVGVDLRLRGANARVIEAGRVFPGDTIRKLD